MSVEFLRPKPGFKVGENDISHFCQFSQNFLATKI